VTVWPTPFISFPDNADSSVLPVCCEDENLDSCVSVSIDPSLLGQSEAGGSSGGGGGDLLLPNNLRLTLSREMLTGDSRTFHYVDPEGTSADATFTCDQDGGCHGLATDADGESYVLEYCGSQGHVWKRPNTESLDEGDDTESLDEEDKPVRSDLDTSNLDEEDEDIEDTTTIAFYSIKFYYTTAFAKNTRDINGYIKRAVAETNLAYINSGVPLRAFALCAEAAPSLPEGDSREALAAFRKLKGSPKALRDTADTAVLLVKSLDVCGIGYLGTIPSGQTFSVVRKSCMQKGVFALAHEIGHNFGLAHDRANANILIYPYGTGHLIDQGRSRNRLGFRTIMAEDGPSC